MNRSRWLFLSFATVAFAILSGLGTWQLARLQTKNAQIAAIDARIAAEAIPLSEALAQQSKGENVEYTKVQIQGQFLKVPDLRKLSTFNGTPGFQLIAPFLTDDNTVILVDRGVIPAEGFMDELWPARKARQIYTGILRAHNKGQGVFDPDNNPEANQWNWWDIPAMLGAVPVPPDAKVSNLILQLLPDEGEQVPPIAPTPKAELRNNHLGYAITWFGLAAALVAVAGAFLMKKR
jgi:surfeit locus 1 family protein